ncbi:MAG: phage portal protein [Phycisphaerales bacterium]
MAHGTMHNALNARSQRGDAPSDRDANQWKAALGDLGLDEDSVGAMLDEQEFHHRPRLQRLWDYYRNPMRDGSAGPGNGEGGGRPSVAQECGLPERLRRVAGAPHGTEIVIENDIAWRIDALVDFVFGKPVTIESAAPDPVKAMVITRVLRAVMDANSGAQLLQDMGLLGFVHGFIDVLVRAEALFEGGAGALGDVGEVSLPDAGGAEIDEPTRVRAMAVGERIAGIARSIRIELIDATRSIPVMDAGDYRRLNGHIAVWRRGAVAPVRRRFSRGVLDALRSRLGGAGAGGALERESVRMIEIRSSHRTHRFEDGRLTHEWENPMGVVPIVHIQNASQPYRYAGLSDVEPLIPLQNELNTRLSDRAHRVTMQSFKMFLAKGIDGFDRHPIAPGQVWIADDPDASIEAFGGDGHAPSEESHIQEIRDALDKASGVSPVVLGVIRERLGHLSSENALRVTLMGVLSKTARKRTVYGKGIERVCELVLRALDSAGVLRTSEEDRRIHLRWQDPLPLDERDRLRSALLKRDLGVPVDQLMGELGYLD